MGSLRSRRDTYREILRLCRDTSLFETCHTLERESGVYFDMEYLKELLNRGNFREAENYLSGFARHDQNSNSAKIFFKIKKAAFCEALDCKDRAKAVEILLEMKFILPGRKDTYREMTELLPLDDIREHPKFVTYSKDTASSRNKLARTLKNLIKRNPVFEGKLVLPTLRFNLLNLEDYTSKSTMPLPSIYNVPRTVALTISLESNPRTMDFHPRNPILLLVGTMSGDVELVDLRQKRSVFHSGLPANVPTIRVVWSPDGLFFGVAYLQNLVEIYSYNDCSESQITRKWEFVAHNGCINDLAFWFVNELRLVLTCGDDRKIQVYNIDSGDLKHTLEGHEAPVYSLCPHTRDNVHYCLSISLDGKIKAWYHNETKPITEFKAPAGRTRFLYTASGGRLFSCCTKGGMSSLVEWNDERSGSPVREYEGLDKEQYSVVHFGITGDYLAAGNDSVIKFWDMNCCQLLGVVDAEGQMRGGPQICFNKEGTLLAVDSLQAKIKILATGDGFRTLQSVRHAENIDISGES